MKAASLRLGAYTAEALLGQGGVTETYRAHGAGGGAPVAVKLLRPDRGGAEPEVAAAFLEASRIAASLNVPGVARVLAVSEGPLVFAVSPLVDGVDVAGLRARAEADGALPAEALAGLGAQIAERLAALHAAAVVHGGVSPGNVIITPNGEVVLLDVGITTAVRPLTEQPIDKWLFAAPELLLGDPALPASDLFGLGAVLFYLATGLPPFVAETRDQLLAQIEAGPPPFPDLPAWFADVVRALLAARPEDRPASAAQVARQMVDPVFRSSVAALVRREAPRRRKTLNAVPAPAPTVPAPPAPFDLPMVEPAPAPPEPLDLPALDVAPLDLPVASSEPALPVAHAFAAVELPADPLPLGPSPFPLAVDTAGTFPAVTPTPLDVGFASLPEANAAVDEPTSGPPPSSPSLSSFFDAPHAGAALPAAELDPMFAPSQSAEIPAVDAGSPVTEPASEPAVARPRRGAGERWQAAVPEATLSADDPSIGPVEDEDELPSDPALAAKARAKKVVVPVVRGGAARRRGGMTGTLAIAGGVLAAGAGTAAWLLWDQLPFVPRAAAPTAPVAVATPRRVVDAGPAATPTSPGELVVRTTPPGAVVWIDGIEQGKSPITIKTKPGGHRVVMILPGHRMVREVAETSAGAVLDRKLVPIDKPTDGPVSMRVLCRTKGKYPVFIDGKETGLLCPAEGIKVPAGLHMVGVFVVPDNKIWSFEREVLTGAQPHRVIFSY